MDKHIKSSILYRIRLVCLSILSILLSLILGINVAYAGYPNFNAAYSNPEAKGVIDEVIAQFKAAGYSTAAIAGVLGSMNTESNFKPNITNPFGCAGLIQHCPRGAYPMSDLKTDVAFEVGFTNSHGWTYGSKDKMNLIASSSGTNASCSSDIHNTDEYKKLTDPACAALAFVANIEIPFCGISGNSVNWCGAGNRESIAPRVSWAVDAYNSGKIGAIDAKADNSKDGNKAKEEGKKAGIVDEGKLVGMAKAKALNNGNTNLPDVPSYNDLSLSDKASIQDFKDINSLQQENDRNTWWGSVIYALGIAIMIYAFALLLALLFDKSNSIFNFSAVGVLTFGHVKKGTTTQGISDDKKFIRQTLVLVGIDFLISCLVLTGFVFKILDFVFSNIK